MSVRRRIVAGWAVLCLGGLAATAALRAEPSAGTAEAPAGEPSPTGPYAVDCREIADHVERVRAEVERERKEALDSSTAPAHRNADVWDMVVPEECADALEGLGPSVR
ncbi:hypothetical protein [Streptomyces griseomycini]|uniref:Secreted protein n=1 Tax=Streptomyces griseomycini TaxID=66895 RepID=A0A7W7PNK6_9ACTN|nr:hypothetical protein [Streptomyces griseomycini]MBB4896507.1 hypothetical protein [Streptomyces griseomycini]GGR01900.1 hypothetical protein GCM10015536_03320 [Streptomyces griseomycini]